MLDISENNFDELVRAIRQTKATIAFNSMRAIATDNGYMSDSDIESEIQCVRAERKNKC